MTDSEILEKIRETLRHKNSNYFMYMGGSGGDTVIQLVYKYSKFFKHRNYTWVRNKFNRTIQIHKSICSTAISTMTLLKDDLKYNIEDNLYANLKQLAEFDNTMYNIPEILSDEYRYLDSYPTLYKFHGNFDINLNLIADKTVFMRIDSFLWGEYSYLLNLIKVNYPTDSLSSELPVADRHAYRLAKSLIESSDSGIKLIPLLMIYELSKSLRGSGFNYVSNQAKNYFCGSISLKEYWENTRKKDRYWKPWNDYGDKYKSSGMKYYDFTEGLTSKVLNDIYEIDDDNFNLELREWHEKNLELMSSYGFDHTPYILKL